MAQAPSSAWITPPNFLVISPQRAFAFTLCRLRPSIPRHEPAIIPWRKRAAHRCEYCRAPRGLLQFPFRGGTHPANFPWRLRMPRRTDAPCRCDVPSPTERRLRRPGGGDVALGHNWGGSAAISSKPLLHARTIRRTVRGRNAPCPTSPKGQKPVPEAIPRPNQVTGEYRSSAVPSKKPTVARSEFLRARKTSARSIVANASTLTECLQTPRPPGKRRRRPSCSKPRS